MKGRPSKKEKYIIDKRNEIIDMLYKENFSQADIARIMRIPRNTVWQVLKK